MKQQKVGNTEQFIEKAKIIHGDKYDYSHAVYEKSSIKTEITCLKHGNFFQRPNDHLSGRGCRECKKETLSNLRKSNQNDFMKKCKIIHGEIYDYSQTNYTESHDKINIICRKHGLFQQTATDHLSGRGCTKCGLIKRAISKTITQQEFLNKAKQIHGSKYDYSKSCYDGMNKKINIKCLKHGDFTQTPLNHIFDKNGCPKCKESKGELRIRNFLESQNIDFSSQFKFETCKHIYQLPFDFMVKFKSKKFLIEFHGEQHYRIATGIWKGSQKQLDAIQKRDNIKETWCKDNNIPLLIIPYTQYEVIENKLIEFFELTQQLTNGTTA